MTVAVESRAISPFSLALRFGLESERVYYRSRENYFDTQVDCAVVTPRGGKVDNQESYENNPSLQEDDPLFDRVRVIAFNDSFGVSVSSRPLSTSSNCCFRLESAALKSASKLLTPSSMSSTSPAMAGSNHHGHSQDLSPTANQLMSAHSALALHALRSPALSSPSSSLHGGQNHNSSLDSQGQTSPSLSNFGTNAMAAHFAMSVPSRVTQLHGSPSHLSKSDGKILSKNSAQSQPTANGFTASPKDDCLTPTPGQGTASLSN